MPLDPGRGTTRPQSTRQAGRQAGGLRVKPVGLVVGTNQTDDAGRLVSAGFRTGKIVQTRVRGSGTAGGLDRIFQLTWTWPPPGRHTGQTRQDRRRLAGPARDGRQIMVTARSRHQLELVTAGGLTAGSRSRRQCSRLVQKPQGHHRLDPDSGFTGGSS